MYYQRSVDQGKLPCCQQGRDLVQWSNKKLECEHAKMIWREEKNMDAALVERFLQLILDTYMEDFEIVLSQDPNMTFGYTF